MGISNYQCTSLDYPCTYYHDANWMKNEITHFIAPLYNKIYLEADYAIETSKTIVDKFIQNCDDNVIRTFLTSSRSFREHVTHCGSFSDGQKNVKAISSTFPESFESFSGNLK